MNECCTNRNGSTIQITLVNQFTFTAWPPTQGAKPCFLEIVHPSVVKGCAPEMISRTFTDHNQGAQPGQLAAGKPQGGFKHTPPQSLKRQIRIGQRQTKKPIT